MSIRMRMLIPALIFCLEVYMKKISVLGTEYTVDYRSLAEDIRPIDCDGYTDFTSKLIVVSTRKDDSDLDDWDAYQRKVTRHEVIHAFLIESGLHSSLRAENGHDEQTIDWMAIQFPKICRVFVELEVL